MSPTVRLVGFLAFLSSTSVFGTTRPVSGLSSAAMTFRRDWLVWCRETIHGFVVDCLSAARELDPHRILMVYGGRTPHARRHPR